jgi:methyl-accepting chemotaxis protein
MKLNMRIGTRILAGYGLALLGVGAVGVVAYRTTLEMVDSADWVSHTHQVKEVLAKALSAVTDAETAERAYLLVGEQRFLDPYDNAAKAAETHLAEIRILTADNPNQQRRLAALQDLVSKRLNKLAQAIDQRKKGGRTGELTAFLDAGATIMNDLRRVMTEMGEEESALLKQRDQRSKEMAHFAMTTIVMGGVGILALVCLLGLLTQRSITRPLASFMQFAGRVGEGDLTHQAKISSADELGELAQHLDQMVAGLKGVAGQTRLVTDNLNSAAAEILSSTQQQAAGAGEQAAAIQQATTTMEEITQSGVQISERAKQVAASAEATSAASRAGLQAVENTNRTMETIRDQAEAVAENVVSLSERTQAIGEIITTVNDLAEQSHLLALNAAIEAAAAGEHGRSFSVIASEVKNLADQSREATVQVRSILGDIQKGINSSVMLTEEAVKRVESGKQQADVADRTIREMTESIQQSVQAFQQIVAGSNQQQIGFTQVMQAVRDIGKASQQTAASTRQLEKAAVNLTALAQQLQKAVERYRL